MDKVYNIVSIIFLTPVNFFLDVKQLISRLLKKKKKNNLHSGKIDQRVKMTIRKSDDLSSIPRSHMVEGEPTLKSGPLISTCHKKNKF